MKEIWIIIALIGNIPFVWGPYKDPDDVMSGLKKLCSDTSLNLFVPHASDFEGMYFGVEPDTSTVKKSFHVRKIILPS